MNSQFDINQYTSENNYIDVFDEIEGLKRYGRRFSLSLPEDFNDIQSDEQTFYIPPAPPTSPQLESQQLAIKVPDDDFYIDLSEFCYHSSEDDSDNDSEEEIKDIQNSLAFSKDDLLISSLSDKTPYKCPPRTSFDARKIWKTAKIPQVAYIRDIESLLIDWAFTYAVLEISGKNIVRISWKSKSNCRCHSTWHAFLQWILCATISI